jgi:Fe-S cluster assembly protein SufD
MPEAQVRLVFVDGRFAPALSATGAQARVYAGSLAQACAERGAAVEPHLARLAAFDDHVFAALNTSFLNDGAFVSIGRGVAAEAPIHVLFLTTQKDVAVYPRCLVVAEAGSAATVVEDYVALTDGAYFNNAVTEVAVAANARVRHVRVQRESAAAFHVAVSAARLERDAAYHSVSVALGARLSRLDCGVHHAGENADCTIDGLALIGGRQLADTHSTVDHAIAHCRTRQLHKTIAGGGAHAVFNGRIVVRPGAQLTDSAQQSRNLLLTDRARVDTKPELEIFADDVKCAHGATVGQLDPEELFYLMSRGLDGRTARNLLTYAFGAEVVDRIPVRSLAARLEQTVMRQTQQD